MGYYDVAQICLNGHVINSSTKEYPQFSEKFCKKCSQPTITQCSSCDESIKGRYSESISFHKMIAPSYCHNCGSAYPWTEAILSAARELVAEEENLTQDEIVRISESLPDIMSETPRTTLAATRIKKVINKMSSTGKEGFKQLLFEITIESAKRLMWPS